MRRERYKSLSQTVRHYLRLYGQGRGQHLTGFGNLVRQNIPDATDEEILRVLRRLHRTWQITLRKFVRCGPFYNVLGRPEQGGLFYSYHELSDSDFFRGEFIVGLA